MQNSFYVFFVFDRKLEAHIKMGNADSTNFRTIYQSWTQPELVPKVTDKPKFDVDYGFAEPNPVRGFYFNK